MEPKGRGEGGGKELGPLFLFNPLWPTPLTVYRDISILYQSDTRERSYRRRGSVCILYYQQGRNTQYSSISTKTGHVYHWHAWYRRLPSPPPTTFSENST
jgi:hypothetical protein